MESLLSVQYDPNIHIHDQWPHFVEQGLLIKWFEYTELISWFTGETNYYILIVFRGPHISLWRVKSEEKKKIYIYIYF